LPLVLLCIFAAVAFAIRKKMQPAEAVEAALELGTV
jgi:hypothetical protein